MNCWYRWFIALISFFAAVQSRAEQEGTLFLYPIGSYRTGIYLESAAEIVAHDPDSQRLFIINGAQSRVDVLDIRDPGNPTFLFSIPVMKFGKQPNSLDVYSGLLAVAVAHNVKTENGMVAFFRTDGQFLHAVEVGPLPDMVTFTPDGRFLLVANEGEPNDDYTIDPEGSVSIIDLSAGIQGLTADRVYTVTFNFANAIADELRQTGVRIYGKNASAAQDFEPEYIAVSPDSRFAWVVLQENNAIAVLNIEEKKVDRIFSLGYKDYSLEWNRLDASDRDGGIYLRNWPVRGLYQPDAIKAFQHNGNVYFLTANEGEGREYKGFSDIRRVADVQLDKKVFPQARWLQKITNLGRLKITTADGDPDNDKRFEALYTFGARSFSIWDQHQKLIFDSGDAFEAITSVVIPEYFNCDSDANTTFDGRSDDKGPEPEGATVGVIGTRRYAFIGLERIGGIMVYDITDPYHPEFINYFNNRNFTGNPSTDTAGDLGPEGLCFIPANQSPIRKPLLMVANEVSGSTTIYQLDQALASEDGSSNYRANFYLAQEEYLRIDILDTDATLLKSFPYRLYHAGFHSITWAGEGSSQANQPFFAVIRAQSFVCAVKMVKQ